MVKRDDSEIILQNYKVKTFFIMNLAWTMYEKLSFSTQGSLLIFCDHTMT